MDPLPIQDFLSLLSLGALSLVALALGLILYGYVADRVIFEKGGRLHTEKLGPIDALVALLLTSLFALVVIDAIHSPAGAADVGFAERRPDGSRRRLQYGGPHGGDWRHPRRPQRAQHPLAGCLRLGSLGAGCNRGLCRIAAGASFAVDRRQHSAVEAAAGGGQQPG